MKSASSLSKLAKTLISINNRLDFVFSLSVIDVSSCAKQRFYYPKASGSGCKKTFLSCACRLEVQMTSDIQAILQMLQRQSVLGPPAYSTVASSPEYHKPAIRVQPGTAVHTQVTHTHSITLNIHLNSSAFAPVEINTRPLALWKSTEWVNVLLLLLFTVSWFWDAWWARQTQRLHTCHYIRDDLWCQLD